MRAGCYLLILFTFFGGGAFAQADFLPRAEGGDGVMRGRVGPLQGRVGPLQADSSFSLLVNTGLSFTHANDPHINKWLAKYHYPTEPHVPSSLNFEVAAIPVASRLMYSVRLSTIISGHNFSSFNLLGGVYGLLVKQRRVLVALGLGAGYHKDIIALNGELPPEYSALVPQYGSSLALHRSGLFIEPSLRAFWFPIAVRQVQVGLFAGLGFDMDINSHWKLGYYDNSHGDNGRFRKIKRPSDQQKVSEYGVAGNVGVSVQVRVR